MVPPTAPPVASFTTVVWSTQPARLDPSGSTSDRPAARHASTDPLHQNVVVALEAGATLDGP